MIMLRSKAADIRKKGLYGKWAAKAQLHSRLAEKCRSRTAKIQYEDVHIDLSSLDKQVFLLLFLKITDRRFL